VLLIYLSLEKGLHGTISKCVPVDLIIQHGKAMRLMKYII